MNSRAFKAVNRETEGTPFLVSPDLRTERRLSDEDSLSRPAMGMVAGLVGGLAGTGLMTLFQTAWSAASSALPSKAKQKEPGEREDQGQQQGEDATMKAADRIARRMGYQLSTDEKKQWGPLIHFLFGTVQGGGYGTAIELFAPRGGLLSGVLFGAALFALVDELAVPALGLSRKAGESPLSSHLYGLGAHLIYGIGTEFTRGAIRKVL